MREREHEEVSASVPRHMRSSATRYGPGHDLSEVGFAAAYRALRDGHDSTATIDALRAMSPDLEHRHARLMTTYSAPCLRRSRLYHALSRVGIASCSEPLPRCLELTGPRSTEPVSLKSQARAASLPTSKSEEAGAQHYQRSGFGNRTVGNGERQITAASRSTGVLVGKKGGT